MTEDREQTVQNEERKQMKKELRKEVLSERDALPEEYRMESDRKIMDFLLQMPEYQCAETIFCFVSMGTEIETAEFLSRALRDGKTVAVPRVLSPGRMEAYRIFGEQDLDAPNRWGIREPKEGCPVVPAEEIDFAVIPCVSMSREGIRLGYGGGYYDRYLSGIRSGACMAALCREKSLRENIPEEAFDIRIPAVITELGLFRID
ncbi:MAG: 5-formyltetrahydrofolate cyclo-ligase [Eubacteriales bacterium]|nr:5-formyltetrahydrofolate cyclo-ligase [Eubacteriales bacterium]